MSIYLYDNNSHKHIYTQCGLDGLRFFAGMWMFRQLLLNGRRQVFIICFAMCFYWLSRTLVMTVWTDIWWQKKGSKEVVIVFITVSRDLFSMQLIADPIIGAASVGPVALLCRAGRLTTYECGSAVDWVITGCILWNSGYRYVSRWIAWDFKIWRN